MGGALHEVYVAGFAEAECDARVTFSVEREAGTPAPQKVRVPNQEEIIRLYVELRPSLNAYLSNLGLVAPEAEDVIQEGFFRLVRDLSAGNEVRNFRGWLFRVAHNLAMDVYRSTNRDQAVDPDNDSPLLRELVDPDPDPEEAYSQQEKRRRVNFALQNLTSQQRGCLLLRAKGMSYHDIGLILGVSTQRVAFLVQRSLAHLADLCG
jgi:RNA polymerase sigma-70 factor, ECF subfamily